MDADITRLLDDLTERQHHNEVLLREVLSRQHEADRLLAYLEGTLAVISARLEALARRQPPSP